jgi:hypothetical protein
MSLHAYVTYVVDRALLIKEETRFLHINAETVLKVGHGGLLIEIIHNDAVQRKCVELSKLTGKISPDSTTFENTPLL